MKKNERKELIIKDEESIEKQELHFISLRFATGKMGLIIRKIVDGEHLGDMCIHRKDVIRIKKFLEEWLKE